MIDKSVYSERINTASAKLEQIRLTLRRLAWGRLIFFLGGILTFYYFLSHNIWVSVGLLVLCWSIFGWLIYRYFHLQKRKEYLENFIEINRQELDFLEGNLNVFSNGNEFNDSDHPFVHDIDAFGEGSVFQFLNRTKMPGGKKYLAEWIKTPQLQPGKIKSSQAMVEEMGKLLDFRHHFLTTAVPLSPEAQKLESVKNWLTGNITKIKMVRSGVLRVLLTGFALAAFFAGVFGLISIKLMGLPFLLNLFIVGYHARRINHVHSKVSKSQRILSGFSSLLWQIEREKFNAENLKSLQDKLSTAEGTSSSETEALKRIVASFDTRLNMVAGIMMNGFFLWDFVCISRLASWKQKNEKHILRWFEVLYAMDAFCSLGNMHFNFPEYPFPEISGDEVLAAKDMGHPLIPFKERVCNDFIIERKGRIQIITGANMAGKSTFLRTIAVNFLFSGMGLPVCASQFTFKPVRIFTSMRTSDSLSKNESYFYAELLRLKNLLHLLEEHDNVLFILDEILKGTNSVDKQKGSAQFLRQLIQKEATGIIATHDLSLGKLEDDFPDCIKNSCFEIEIEGANIRFDYKLHPGITKKMNALILMKQMGIFIEDDE